MDRSKAKAKYDVILIGAGVTGLASALHLRRHGIDNILLLDENPRLGASAGCAGYLAGGLVDNFTRITNAHGGQAAAALWRLGDQAFDAAIAFCESNGVQVHRGRRLRLVTSEPELKEARLAVEQMHQHGIAGELLNEVAKKFPYFHQRVLAVQDDGDRAAFVDVAAYLDALRQQCQITSLAERAIELETNGDSALVKTNNGMYQAQMVVLGNHLAIGDLLPTMRAALVSYADQWSYYDCGGEKVVARGLSGHFLTANHTHEWGVMAPDGKMHWGGGRYLRKFAGIEAKTASHEFTIEQHLQQQLIKTLNLSSASSVTVNVGVATLDCRPCDELPLIGPMFGENRILLATGYMGQGLTLGFLAGKYMADLVATGSAKGLPELVLPRRLRSLPESG